LTSIRGTYVFEVWAGREPVCVRRLAFPQNPSGKSTLTAVVGSIGGRVGFDWYRKRRLFEETFFCPASYGVTFPHDSDRKYKQPGYMDSERDSEATAKTGPSHSGHVLPSTSPAPACRASSSTSPPPGVTTARQPFRPTSTSEATAQVQRRAALLQAVFQLRAIHAFPVPQAHPGAHRHEGQS